MSKSKKFILGILTFLPFVFFGLYIYNFFQVFNSFNTVIESQDSGADPVLMAANFQVLAQWAIIMTISGLAMAIYFVVHANRRKDIDGNKKIMWTLLILLLSGIGSTAYYFVEILPLPNDTSNNLNEDS